jgi:hypothetical protein
MADYDESKAPKKQSSTAAPAPKPKSQTRANFHKVLGGKPKGRGLAEIRIATRGSDIEVGMKGLLLGYEGSFEITAVRPGVATALLEGKGVEKLDYSTLLVNVEPSKDFVQSNRTNIEHPQHVDLDEVRRRFRPGSGG